MLTSWERSMVCQLDGVYSPPVVEPRHTARGTFPAAGGEGEGVRVRFMEHGGTAITKGKNGICIDEHQVC
jgi:hypothetical protein